MKKIDHFHQLMISTEISESENFQQIFQFEENTQFLSETRIASLNVVNRSKNQIFFSNLKKSHIIEKNELVISIRNIRRNMSLFLINIHLLLKKIRKFSRFMQRFLVEINKISGISIHAKDLSPLSTN